MEQNRLENLQKIEEHGAENGWVASLTEDDREFLRIFALFLSGIIFHRQKQRAWNMTL